MDLEDLQFSLLSDNMTEEEFLEYSDLMIRYLEILEETEIN